MPVTVETPSSLGTTAPVDTLMRPTAEVLLPPVEETETTASAVEATVNSMAPFWSLSTSPRPSCQRWTTLPVVFM